MTSLSPADHIRGLPAAEQEAFFAALTDDEAQALLHDWKNFLARPDQLAPVGDWRVWIVLAGRGFGKTRMGAEFVRQEVEAGRAKNIALVAETAADARDVMVEGVSGLLAVHEPHRRPIYEPSKRRVSWPNGARATLFNGTEPDQLRGPQFDLAWVDELAKYRYAREAWDQLQFGLRLGDHPRVLVTTTPRPIDVIKAIVAGKEGTVAVTRGSTYDNRDNLAASFVAQIEARYGNTRLGRQELNGEILGDTLGALWSQASIDPYRVESAPKHLRRVVVSIDPAASADDDEGADENGIVVVGCTDNEGYVLEDASLSGGPLTWARRAVAAYHQHEADAIVCEVNNGGEMVAHTIRSVDDRVKIIQVRATRGKHLRAEPIAALYEQGRVHHCGAFAALEDQMTSTTSGGYVGAGSPDRMDALVHGLTELFGEIVRPRREVKPARAALARPRQSASGWMSA